MARKRDKREKRRAVQAEWSKMLQCAYLDLPFSVGRGRVPKRLVRPSQLFKTGKARPRSSKHVSKLLLLLALLSSAHAARPWSVQFGGCVFSGDYDGAPLERSGSCPTRGGALMLRKAGITSVKNDSFAGMVACEELYLNENAISVLPAGTFDQLTSLRYLSLYGNAISVLLSGTFDQLTSLQVLYLGHGGNSERTNTNAISFLPASIFDRLTSLQTLLLNVIAISVLPAGIFDRLTSLNYLDLSENAISVLPVGVFDQLTSLWSLRLDGNAISVLPAGTFDRLASLEYLYLNVNAISILPAGTFDRLTRLAYLYVRCDPSWNPSDFPHCAAERDNAALTCVPLTQGRMTAITYYGPRVTCEYSTCTAGNAGPVGGTCASCGAGFFPAHPCIKRNTCMLHACQ